MSNFKRLQFSIKFQTIRESTKTLMVSAWGNAIKSSSIYTLSLLYNTFYSCDNHVPFTFFLYFLKAQGIACWSLIGHFSAVKGIGRLGSFMAIFTRETCRPWWHSWMRRPTGDQEVAGSTPAEIGNILSWRLIMKYFLRSFSPFRWFKKGSCQFPAKECAQYWLTA